MGYHESQFNSRLQHQIEQQIRKPVAPKTLADAIMQPLKTRPALNKKIKNATKVDMHGTPISNFSQWKKSHPNEIYFDSKLEWYMCALLHKAGIQYELKQCFTLQEAFVWQGETVKKIEMKPDFLLPYQRMVIDTKGHKTKEFEMKLKMLKALFFHKGWGDFQIHLPSTKEECDKLILQIMAYKQKQVPFSRNY